LLMDEKGRTNMETQAESPEEGDTRMGCSSRNDSACNRF
jgi:hypothetical protein